MTLFCHRPATPRSVRRATGAVGVFVALFVAAVAPGPVRGDTAPTEQLQKVGPGTRLSLTFASRAQPLGVVAGPEGARALLHNQRDPSISGPATTAFSLHPGETYTAPARFWAWNVPEKGRFEIEVYQGTLAAFRITDDRAIPADVAQPGGLWTLYGPRHLRWGLLAWMILLTVVLSVLTGRFFRLPLRPAWAVLLAVLALAPVLPALSTARLLGSFDLQAQVPPWRGPLNGPPFEPATPHLGDISNHLVPWQIEARRQLLAGRPPLLDPWVGGGQALLGDGQSAPFSLLSVLSLPFEPPTAQALRAFLKVLLALLGTFLAARLLDVRAPFALAAALGYAFGGSMSLWKLHPQTEVMALWPWLFLAVERLIRGEREGRPALLAGAALTGMLLAGHPETAAMALGAVAVRWGWEWAFGGWRRSRPGLLRFLAAFIAAGGLAAVAVLPLAGTVPHSMKVATNAGEGTPWSVRPTGLPLSILLHLSAPGVFGTWQDGNYQGIGSFANISEGAVGLALLALAAAALPLLTWRSPRESVLPLLAAGGLALHALVFGIDRLWASMPGISHVSPRYAAYLAAFALALLGGLGLERLTRAEAGRRRLVLALGVGLAVGIVLAAGPVAAGAIAGRDGVPRWVARLQVVSWSACAWACAGAALPLLAWLLRRRSRLVGALAAVAVVGQMATAYLHFVPTVPSVLAYPEIPLFDALRQGPPGRVIGTRGVMVPNAAAVYHFEDVRAHDPTTWGRYDRWLARTLDMERGSQIAQYIEPLPDHRAPLTALSTRYLVAFAGLDVPPPWRDAGTFGCVRLWELDRTPRWAFFPEKVVGVGSAEEAFGLTRGDHPAQELAPLEAPGLAPGARERTAQAARVLGVERRGVEVQVRVNTLEDAWLVVSQAAIPGWQARVDGQEVPIAVAYGALTAVHVPRGGRLVELRYRPLGWRVGAPISGLTAVLLLAGGLIGRWRRRPGSATETSPRSTESPRRS